MPTQAPTSAPPGRQLLALAAILGVTLAAAGTGGLATSGGLDPWYAQLDKPPWQPPESWFGPVWSVLYVLMAVAAWLVWRAGGRSAATALTLYGVQLVLNVAWSLLFFGAQAPTLALIDIGLLLIAIVATMWAFARWSRAAVALFVPYLLWAAFATALNAEIVRLNA